LADVEIRPFHGSQTEELLKFLVKWTPNHPELGRRDVFEWQKANSYVAMYEGRIVGHLAQIPHEFRYGKISGRDGAELMGPGISFILDMSDDEIRKKSGRELLRHFENNQPPYFAAIGIVPEIEEPYKRRGYAIRRDFTNLYARFMNPSRALKYWSRSLLYAPAIVAANLVYRPLKKKSNLPVEKITEFKPEWDELWEKLKSEQYELYGVRNADFLNYKLSQPGKEYHVYKHADGGYIVYRLAVHLLKELQLVKVCDIAGSAQIKLDLLSLAIDYASEVKVDGIVAMASVADKDIYRKAGLYISEPKPLVISPHIKAKMHVTFFDSDLDNLW
jgi:hypothetical protein